MKIFKLALCASLLILTSCSKDSWWGDAKVIDIKGERISVTSTDKDLIVDTQYFSNKKLSIGSPQNNNSWPQGSGISNNVPSNILLNEINASSITFSVNGESQFHTGTTPVIENNVLYAMGNDGIVLAFDTATGNELWQNKYFFELEKKSFFDFFSKYFINGSLTISNETLYITSGTDEVLAVDAQTGNTKWVAKLSSPSRSAPIIVNNKVIIQSIDNKVFALDSTTGEILWNHFGVGEEVSVLSASAPTTDGKMIIAQYTTGEVFAIDINTGQEIWVENISAPLEAASSTFVQLNVVTSPYIGSGKVIAFGNDGYMAAIDSNNGTLIWRKELGINRQFWVASDYIFAINRNNQLLAIDKVTGKLKWISELKSDSKETYTSPIVANSEIYVISSLGKILRFNFETGELISTLDAPQGANLQPIIVNGSLYLSLSDGAILKY
jgi:outer membrane protein assembly factor BamB